ncbi:unnamed protein product [Didymodactylos carnosus]|uniref:Uncharacterized protein n=1 Tax=Didymodactylos carnosus TaxID=1234261 RepID=A0A813ZFC9_9BILA|nr:unnamed protein product [Didymodactylos carnosus]CAF0897674.1 unnamed protein product [Didymodactylos carnosus]CAF3515095.1 unnamed protein product [Didymodactylos carnosus]CAF3680663.1 unnamed protein product [Didymodactylos carnosus]
MASIAPMRNMTATHAKSSAKNSDFQSDMIINFIEKAIHISQQAVLDKLTQLEMKSKITTNRCSAIEQQLETNVLPQITVLTGLISSISRRIIEHEREIIKMKVEISRHERYFNDMLHLCVVTELLKKEGITGLYVDILIDGFVALVQSAHITDAVDADTMTCIDYLEHRTGEIILSTSGINKQYSLDQSSDRQKIL